ncbi:MAG TPA: restriction endonuclease [Sphingobacteriaceae bacterium]
MKKTKSDIQRDTIINALKCKSRAIDLFTLDGIDNDTDVNNLSVTFEAYIAKYPTCGLKLDLRTSSLEKSLNVQKIAAYIDNLSASKFEKYIALLVQLFGYELTYATKSSHDQGIDFMGVKKFRLFDSKRKSYLIGQAKKYNTLVNISEIREFAGSVLLLRNREFSQTKSVYATVFMKSFTTIEGVFATSYFFSDPAILLCENSDIITLDFVDLVLLTEKAILEKKLQIEHKDVFVKSKTDRELERIQILR